MAADIGANMVVEQFSQHKPVYTISSRLGANEDEPFWLLTNDNLTDYKVAFLYISDGDCEEEEPENNPIPESLRKY